MAIVIPSKNIYGTPNNAKVRDNIFNVVEISPRQVLPNNTIKSNVFSKTFYGEFAKNQEKYKRENVVQNIVGETDSINYPYYHIRVAYSGIAPIYLTIDELKVPIHKENAFISELVLQEGDRETTNYSVYGKVDISELNQSFSVTYQNAPLNNPQFSYGTKPNAPNPTETIEYISPITLDNLFSREEIQQTPDKEDLVASPTILNNTNLKSISYSTDTKNDCFVIKNIVLLVGAIYYGATFYDKAYLPNVVGSTYTYTGTLKINCEQYIPEYVEINIYGNTIGIKLQEKNLKYGIGNKPHTLSGNELLQEGTTTIGDITSERLSNLILNGYKDGKETAKILCSISEYYNDFGSLAISTKQEDKPMTFEVGDYVIPMVKSAQGEDKPMSRYKDGSSKVFEVVKTNFIYDGATWQELTLQEETYKGE